MLAASLDSLLDSELFSLPPALARAERAPTRVVGLRPVPREPAYEFFVDGERVTEALAQVLGLAADERIVSANPAGVVQAVSQRAFGVAEALVFQEDRLVRVPPGNLPNRCMHGHVLAVDGDRFVLSTGQGEAKVLPRSALAWPNSLRAGHEVYLSFDAQGRGTVRTPEQHMKHEFQSAMLAMGVDNVLVSAARVQVEHYDDARLAAEPFAFNGVVVAATARHVALALEPRPGETVARLALFPAERMPGVARGDALEVVNTPERGWLKVRELAREVGQEILASLAAMLARTRSRGPQR